MPVDFSLYLISDRHQIHPDYDLLSAMEAALKGGVQAVQLREKDLPDDQLFELARQLRSLTRRYRAKLLINDRADIALTVEADGVHLTEQSLSVATTRRLLGANCLIAASCHSLERAVQAEQEGADFITFSPIYYTASKAAYGPPQGLTKLQQVCRSLGIPVFALGGITVERQAEVEQAGASGIALISAILASTDPTAAAREFLVEAIDSCRPNWDRPGTD